VQKTISKLRWKSYYKEYESFISLLEYEPNTKLLDIGCENGSFTLQYALKIGTNAVIGIDIKNWGVPFSFVEGNVEVGLPFKDKSFDIVTAAHIIEHLSNTDLFAKEIYRVLKVGGYALVATPNLASGRVIMELLFNKQPNSAHVSDFFILRGDPNEEWRKSIGHLHKRLFTLEGLEKLLVYYNFKLENKIGVGYGPLFFGSIFRGRYSANIIVKARK